jgi:glycosyltransferase involved in cell wall biosynthesis
MATFVSSRRGLVSVVVPCYNQANFLAEAIDSVLAQTYGRIEVVVVNDGSTDDTAAVASRYERVRCISQLNGGQGAARNEGLKHATGEYVLFLDSDDRLLPPALEIGVQCLASRPGCAFAAGRCVYIGPDGGRRRTTYLPVIDRNHYLNLLITNYIWTPGAVLFRTAVVRHLGGFKTTVSGAEDYDLYLRIARNHRIWCHGNVVVEYRQHGANFSRNPGLMLRSTLDVIHAQRGCVGGNKLAERALRRATSKAYSSYGEPLVNSVGKQVRARQWRRAVSAIAALLQYYPTGVLAHARRKLRRVALGYKRETGKAIG